MGFAYAPRIFLIFHLIPIPPLQFLLRLAVVLWVWIGMVKAVKQALDYHSTMRAVGVTIIGAFINGIAISVLAVLLGAGPETAP